MKIGVYSLCLLPAGTIILFTMVATDSPMPKYFLSSVATLASGMGLSYLAPILTWKWRIMKFLPGPATEYEHKLE